jgi:ketosteroid isomerase-like protein
MDESTQAMIERLFDAFNRRDPGEIRAVCDEEMEFFAVTAEEVGRPEPYTGIEGLYAYLEDVATVWEELLITASECERRGDSVLVRGRVYLRSRAQGIRDMPVSWIWDIRGGRFIRGRAFPDPEEGVRRFRLEARPEPSPDPDASRSMTPRP